MTSFDQAAPSGRFGAATPGGRPSPPSLEELLAAPPAPRRRLTARRILAIVVLLAVAGAGCVAGHYTWSTPAPTVTQRVIIVTALPAGARLTGADLRVVTVQTGAGAPPAGTLTPAAAARVIGLVTRSAVPAGTFVTHSMLAPSGAIPGPAQALVGLALKPGQLPAGGLSVGEQVLVIALPTNSAGTALSPVPLFTTTVWFLQAPDSSGNTDATVIAPAQQEAVLASYAARSEIALVGTATASAPAPAASSPSPAASTNPKRAKSGNKKNKKNGKS